MAQPGQPDDINLEREYYKHLLLSSQNLLQYFLPFRVYDCVPKIGPAINEERLICNYIIILC